MKFYYKDGTSSNVLDLNKALHKEDGPAFEIKETECLKTLGTAGTIVCDISDSRNIPQQRWYINGEKHRLDGPAIIKGVFEKVYEWWINGVQIDTNIAEVISKSTKKDQLLPYLLDSNLEVRALAEYKLNKIEKEVRPSWDEYFINIANIIKTRSHDLETQVGAVIVSDSNKILSTGYNGFPSGANDNSLPNTRPMKYPYMIHAELNAIITARQDLRDSTIYCNLSPCSNCAKAIIAAGIKRVVYEKSYGNDDSDFAIELLKSCNIQVEEF